MMQGLGAVSIGSDISGYNVRDFLGRGVFGDSYRVAWGDTSDKFTIKLIKKDFIKKYKLDQVLPDLIQRVIDLDLESVLNVLDFGEYQDYLWICSDYICQNEYYDYYLGNS